MLKGIKGKIKERFEKEAIALLRPVVGRLLNDELPVRLQLAAFENAKAEELASYWEGQFDAVELAKRFVAAGMEVESVSISREGFRRFMEEYPEIVRYYAAYGDVKIEKILEHYLTMTFLGVNASDVLIDVASAGSPFAPALRGKGISAFQQDLVFKPGVRDGCIGGDAGAMPVEDGFASVLTLHCAFECFQGDTDVRFAKEAGRVLQPGGRIGIVPLYTDTASFVKTSPWCDKRKVDAGGAPLWVWRDDEYREPFSRHYAPEDFFSRIAGEMKKVKGKMLHFTNLEELEDHYPRQRIYCHFMFKGERE